MNRRRPPKGPKLSHGARCARSERGTPHRGQTLLVCLFVAFLIARVSEPEAVARGSRYRCGARAWQRKQANKSVLFGGHTRKSGGSPRRHCTPPTKKGEQKNRRTHDSANEPLMSRRRLHFGDFDSETRWVLVKLGTDYLQMPMDAHLQMIECQWMEGYFVSIPKERTQTFLRSFLNLARE